MREEVVGRGSVTQPNGPESVAVGVGVRGGDKVGRLMGNLGLFYYLGSC